MMADASFIPQQGAQNYRQRSPDALAVDLLDTVPAEVKQVLTDVAALAPDTFYEKYFENGHPPGFSNTIGYNHWKQHLATRLGISTNQILVVGSGAIGVSLNPTNNFSLFSDASDIDIAIISPSHFDIAWAELRSFASDHARQLGVTRQKRNAVEAHRRGLLFDGCIATNAFLSVLPFGGKWRDALGQQEAEEPFTGLDLKTRIYHDPKALREYQLKSIRTARQRIGEIISQVGAPS